ncbi:PKD domain-containing protein [Pedobacter sp. P351]|uniref:PKD domain-containing protein n=1 Tax=Pedobacter superstes TaxID=3133441 RepID=UPI00309F3893
MRVLASAFVFILSFAAQAQVVPVDTIPAVIEVNQDSAQLKFSASLRELRQIAGAPVPFYTYFWEFGDGSFSFEKDPLHSYRDTGTFDIRVYATNNYDDGKPPPTKPKKINITKAPPTPIRHAGISPTFFKSDGSIELKTNRMPKPAEDMVLLIGYRNKAEWNIPNLSGKLAILYNERQFKQDNFLLKETRNHHKEQKSSLNTLMAYVPFQKIFEEDWKQKGGPAIIEKVKPNENSRVLKDKAELFRNSEVWKFENIKQGEERFMFISLNTTPEMLQDTNAVVTISAVFIPDDPLLEHEVVDLQLQIVASHDPNKMMLKNRRMNYRFTGKKQELTYKVRFQNTGEGPAKKVAIGIRAAGSLDVSSVQISDSQPKCIPCNLAYSNQSCLERFVFKDSVGFVFKNIYLPGVKQKGVSDMDSTMGYIEYAVNFKKKPKKVPFDSQAAIVFDKNEPIYTNRSVGRFKPGFSPGIIAVYGTRVNNTALTMGNKNFSLGLSIAPFSPYRKYLQWELYVSTFNESETFLGRRTGGDTIINRIGYKVAYRDQFRKSKVISIDVVPAQLRYNLNSFIGFGAGAIVSSNLKTTNEKTKNTSLENPNGQRIILNETQKEENQGFNQWQSSLFADIQLGMVRVGPSLGIRYLYALNINDRRFSTYLAWKF